MAKAQAAVKLTKGGKTQASAKKVNNDGTAIQQSPSAKTQKSAAKKRFRKASANDQEAQNELSVESRISVLPSSNEESDYKSSSKAKKSNGKAA